MSFENKSLADCNLIQLHKLVDLSCTMLICFFRNYALIYLSYEKINFRSGNIDFSRPVIKSKRKKSHINWHQDSQLHNWQADCDFQLIIDHHACIETDRDSKVAAWKLFMCVDEQYIWNSGSNVSVSVFKAAQFFI